jgi:hypothetical protein
MIEIAVNAYGTKNRMRFARGSVNVKAAADQTIDDMLDLGVGGAFLHYDDHEIACVLFCCGP